MSKIRVFFKLPQIFFLGLLQIEVEYLGVKLYHHGTEFKTNDLLALRSKQRRGASSVEEREPFRVFFLAMQLRPSGESRLRTFEVTIPVREFRDVTAFFSQFVRDKVVPVVVV
jgi:hypothetical protein